MASNRNFYGSRFLVGSRLVGVKGFHLAEVAYLVSAFGTPTPGYSLDNRVEMGGSVILGDHGKPFTCTDREVPPDFAM